jgi:hypothetical protein
MVIKYGNHREYAGVKYLITQEVVMASDMTPFSFLKKVVEGPSENWVRKLKIRFPIGKKSCKGSQIFSNPRQGE